jgi:hypothetical protein
MTRSYVYEIDKWNAFQSFQIMRLYEIFELCMNEITLFDDKICKRNIQTFFSGHWLASFVRLWKKRLSTLFNDTLCKMIFHWWWRNLLVTGMEEYFCRKTRFSSIDKLTYFVSNKSFFIDCVLSDSMSYSDKKVHFQTPNKIECINLRKWIKMHLDASLFSCRCSDLWISFSSSIVFFVI